MRFMFECMYRTYKSKLYKYTPFFSLIRASFPLLLPHFYLLIPTFPLPPSLHLFPPSHSGLNLAPVARLRSSWEKLPSKYEKLFGDLQDVFDPSRNMAKYRNILSSQSMQPPIIPLFPVVKKDLTFLHEGRRLCGKPRIACCAIFVY